MRHKKIKSARKLERTRILTGTSQTFEMTQYTDKRKIEIYLKQKYSPRTEHSTQNIDGEIYKENFVSANII